MDMPAHAQLEFGSDVLQRCYDVRRSWWACPASGSHHAADSSDARGADMQLQYAAVFFFSYLGGVCGEG